MLFWCTMLLHQNLNWPQPLWLLQCSHPNVLHFYFDSIVLIHPLDASVTLPEPSLVITSRTMDPGATTRHTTSSVGHCTASTTAHLSCLPIAPSLAWSPLVSSSSQYCAYWSYLDPSDEEILEKLAWCWWHCKGEAPSEFPQHSSAPVCSQSNLGAHGLLAPSTAQPAATPSHAGSWVYTSPYCVVNLSPSCSPLGPLPALSISSEAHTQWKAHELGAITVHCSSFWLCAMIVRAQVV